MRLLSVEGASGRETTTDSDGRFLPTDIRRSRFLSFTHPNNTTKLYFVPGDDTVDYHDVRGDGENVIDEGESYQYQSVFTANLIAHDYILGLMGVYGGVGGQRRQLSKILVVFIPGLWSRGMIIGPLLILSAWGW